MPALRSRRARPDRPRRRARRRETPSAIGAPHLALVRAPVRPMSTGAMPGEITVATYNVHRWTGLSGRAAPDPARAGFVLSELDADVVALQEVLRPSHGDDPLLRLGDALGLHVAFAVTRVHRRGQLGNAILSRWPIAGVSIVDLSFSRLERRVAVVASFDAKAAPGAALNVMATHLALVDRTRRRQVRSLLDHAQLREGPSVLLGDMNAWRRCSATRALDRELDSAHHNRAWPPSFPAARPVLALDRIYSQGAEILEVAAHDSPAARRASDHLPVVARVKLPEDPQP